MAPATVLAQVIVFAALAPFGHWGTVTPHDVPLIVAFGSIQMAGGVGLFTVAARLVPAAELAMLLMLEVVLGPLWVWIAFDNRPNTPTLIGGAVVLAAVAIQTRVRASPALSYDG
jgi:drug/metabolite transporter (DMT)-like permease